MLNTRHLFNKAKEMIGLLSPEEGRLAREGTRSFTPNARLSATEERTTITLNEVDMAAKDRVRDAQMNKMAMDFVVRFYFRYIIFIIKFIIK